MDIFLSPYFLEIFISKYFLTPKITKTQFPNISLKFTDKIVITERLGDLRETHSFPYYLRRQFGFLQRS